MISLPLIIKKKQNNWKILVVIFGCNQKLMFTYICVAILVKNMYILPNQWKRIPYNENQKSVHDLLQQ